MEEKMIDQCCNETTSIMEEISGEEEEKEEGFEECCKYIHENFEPVVNDTAVLETFKLNFSTICSMFLHYFNTKSWTTKFLMSYFTLPSGTKDTQTVLDFKNALHKAMNPHCMQCHVENEDLEDQNNEYGGAPVPISQLPPPPTIFDPKELPYVKRSSTFEKSSPSAFKLTRDKRRSRGSIANLDAEVFGHRRGTSLFNFPNV